MSFCSMPLNKSGSEFKFYLRVAKRRLGSLQTRFALIQRAGFCSLSELGRMWSAKRICTHATLTRKRVHVGKSAISPLPNNYRSKCNRNPRQAHSENNPTKSFRFAPENRKNKGASYRPRVNARLMPEAEPRRRSSKYLGWVTLSCPSLNGIGLKGVGGYAVIGKP